MYGSIPVSLPPNNEVTAEQNFSRYICLSRFELPDDDPDG